MKYKNFNNFKMNESESSIMSVNNFSDFKFFEETYCDYNIFDKYPKYSFVIIINEKCFVYSKDKKRERYEDLNTLEIKKGLDLSKNSIISTKDGQYIKEQYEQISGVDITDILKFIEK